MDRSHWIGEKRRLCEERMNTLFAPDYDEHWGRIDSTHYAMLEGFLGLCPPGCEILDAACGTGKYWTLVLDSGRSVLGLDQSGGMLQKARDKFPDVPTRKLGLQEISYERAFGGIMCVDAMENVFPEDWPLVLGNFRRALEDGGYLHFTVELAPREEIREAFVQGRRMGLPLFEGEHAHEGGYHYYPSIERVRDWTHAAGFEVVREVAGDGYHHLLARGA